MIRRVRLHVFSIHISNYCLDEGIDETYGVAVVFNEEDEVVSVNNNNES